MCARACVCFFHCYGTPFLDDPISAAVWSRQTSDASTSTCHCLHLHLPLLPPLSPTSPAHHPDPSPPLPLSNMISMKWEWEFHFDHFEWSRSSVASSVLEILQISLFFVFLWMDEFYSPSTWLLRRPLTQFVVYFSSLGPFIYDHVKSRYLPLKVGRLGPSNNHTIAQV